MGVPYLGSLLMGCEWEYPPCRKAMCGSCCSVLNPSVSSVLFSKMPLPEVANKFIPLTDQFELCNVMSRVHFVMNVF